jgi:hypothetical protein
VVLRLVVLRLVVLRLVVLRLVVGPGYSWEVVWREVVWRGEYSGEAGLYYDGSLGFLLAGNLFSNFSVFKKPDSRLKGTGWLMMGGKLTGIPRAQKDIKPHFRVFECLKYLLFCR